MLTRLAVSIQMTAKQSLALAPQHPLPWLICLPVFVAGQRFGGNDGDDVVGGGVLFEVDFQFQVAELCRAERCAAGDPVEFAGAQGEQPVAVAEHQVADAKLDQWGAAVAECSSQVFERRRRGVAACQGVEQVTEEAFAVGIANGGVGPG